MYTPFIAMKKLFIVRHAKSSWSEDKEDFDRKLKKRGMTDAGFMAEKLLSRGVKIQKIISSSAKRTTDTALIMNDYLGVQSVHVEFTKNLYLASPKEVISLIREMDDNINELMIVAHNPSVTQVVNHLANEHFENIPTLGIACILFDDKSWSTIKNNGKLGFYIFPKMFKQKN